MFDLFYEHPILGRLKLHEHPRMPCRLVAYFNGTAIYETDKPDGWPGQVLADDQDLEDFEDEEEGVSEEED